MMAFFVGLLIAIGYLLQAFVVQGSPTQLRKQVRSELVEREASSPLQALEEGDIPIEPGTPPNGLKPEDCPPCNFIGYGIDLTGADPFDAEQVCCRHRSMSVRYDPAKQTN